MNISLRHQQHCMTCVCLPLWSNDSCMIPQCCLPAQIPFISATALHDIHIFIFVIGASHILTCCAVFLLASFQVPHMSFANLLSSQQGTTPSSGQCLRWLLGAAAHLL